MLARYDGPEEGALWFAGFDAIWLKADGGVSGRLRRSGTSACRISAAYLRTIGISSMAMTRFGHLHQSDRRSAKDLALHLALAEPDCGFMLIELIATMCILMVLTCMALPLARVQVQREREVELRRALREIREAIDRHKEFADRGMIAFKMDSSGYPSDLNSLVNGVAIKGTKSNQKYRLLRSIPVDPMTGKPNWGLRSTEDDPDSRSWSGLNVYDVYSQSQMTALDGTRYCDW